MRAVLDTNILISAFVFPGGAPEAVFRAAIDGRIRAITSPTLLAEFGRVLGSKFAWDDAHVEDAVALVARVCEVVRPSERVSVIERDPADDRVLEAAVAGRAEVIVSGDRDLLRLGSWRDVTILDTQVALERLRGDP